MKLVSAFLRLIRWPNLVFIVVTQCLFYYLIAVPVFIKNSSAIILTQNLFWLLVVSSVLIAAAGYIINDYFDLNIDRVNKPDKLVVEKIIKHSKALGGISRFTFMMNPGSLSQEKLMQATKLICTQVAPALREQLDDIGANNI